MNTSNTILKNIFSSVFSFLEGIVKTVFSSFVFKKGCNLRTFYRIFSSIIEYIKFIQIDNKQPYGSRKSSRQDVYPYDNYELGAGGGYGQGSSFESNINNDLEGDGAYLESYINMFKATNDKKYLNQFIIHSNRVQTHRDD